MRADCLSRTVSTKDEKAADLEDDSALVFTLGSASEQDTPVTPSVRRPPGGRRTIIITRLHPATVAEFRGDESGYFGILVTTDYFLFQYSLLITDY